MTARLSSHILAYTADALAASAAPSTLRFFAACLSASMSIGLLALPDELADESRSMGSLLLPDFALAFVPVLGEGLDGTRGAAEPLGAEGPLGPADLAY